MSPEFSDVSYPYQAGLDLDTYTRSGRDRLLVKASEGTGYTNPLFAIWWQRAKTLGLARGAYHFARPSQSSGTAEADHFVAAVEGAGGAGPRDWVCLDAEDPNDHANLGGRHAADFANRLVQHGYPTGVIYSGTWYATPVGLTAGILPPGWRRLHLATYNTAVADSAMPLPAGWDRTQVVARQYTNQAVQPGIPGKSDSSRVLREWLPTLGGLVLDDPTAQQMAGIVRAVLNEGTGAGQPAWAATEKAILSLEQTVYNGVNAIIAALGWNKGDLSLAARSDAISSEVGQIVNYLGPTGEVVAALNALSQQLVAVLTAIKALPVSTAGGADLTPVLSRLDALTAALTGLTLRAVLPASTANVLVRQPT